jgi:peptidoglycan/xylan/chitin deacetylase (PgdA/CDA1 family)
MNHRSRAQWLLALILGVAWTALAPRVVVAASGGPAATASGQAAVAVKPVLPASPVLQTASQASPKTADAASSIAAKAPANVAQGGDIYAGLVGKRLTRGLHHSKLVALTFDDGPSPQNTPKVIEILKKAGVKATFFMIGEMVEKSPQTAKMVADAGFEIGDHSVSHANLIRLSPDRVWQEIDGALQTIQGATGRTARLLRPPYGNINKNVIASAKKDQLVMCLWSIDTNDWKPGATPAKILEAVKKQTTGGDIILMHDIHAKTLAALPEIIQFLKDGGYKMVTVSELLREKASAPAAATGVSGDAEAADPDAPPPAPLTMSLGESSKY